MDSAEPLPTPLPMLIINERATGSSTITPFSIERNRENRFRFVYFGAITAEFDLDSKFLNEPSEC